MTKLNRIPNTGDPVVLRYYEVLVDVGGSEPVKRVQTLRYGGDVIEDGYVVTLGEHHALEPNDPRALEQAFKAAVRVLSGGPFASRTGDYENAGVTYIRERLTVAR